jgi:hypothetical protein
MAIRLTFRSIPLLAVGAYLAACGSAGTASADGCDLVAARDGSDNAAGTAAAPFKTAQKLADRLEPGQTGCLREGTYAETPNGPHVLQFSHGGREGAPLTIRSFPGERAKLLGIVWVRKGSDHVTLSGVDIDGRGEESGNAVSIQMMATDTVIENNDITNRHLRSCMIIGSNSGWGQARDITIRGNVFHECGSLDNGIHDHSIYVENLDGGEITGNVFWGSAAWAVQLYPNAKRVAVTRNVMDDNYGGVIVASENDFTSSGNVIERNIISNSGEGRPVKTSWGGPVGIGNVARGNCLDGSGGTIRADDGLDVGDNVVASPGYVDRAAHDYRLVESSQCRAVVGGDPASEIGAAWVDTSPVLGRKVALKKKTGCARYRKGTRTRKRCLARAARARARRA